MRSKGERWTEDILACFNFDTFQAWSNSFSCPFAPLLVWQHKAGLRRDVIDVRCMFRRVVKEHVYLATWLPFWKLHPCWGLGMPGGHPQPAAEKVLEKAEDWVPSTIFQRQQCVLFFRHSNLHHVISGNENVHVSAKDLSLDSDKFGNMVAVSDHPKSSEHTEQMSGGFFLAMRSKGRKMDRGHLSPFQFLTRFKHEATRFPCLKGWCDLKHDGCKPTSFLEYRHLVLIWFAQLPMKPALVFDKIYKASGKGKTALRDHKWSGHCRENWCPQGLSVQNLRNVLSANHRTLHGCDAMATLLFSCEVCLLSLGIPFCTETVKAAKTFMAVRILASS